MRILIKERYKPFSHLPGTKVLIPGTAHFVQIFPTRLIFFHIGTKKKLHTIDFLLKGPMGDFTIELDLEKELVRVFMHTQEGFISYTISSQDGEIALEMKRAFEKIECVYQGKERFFFSPKEKRSLFSIKPCSFHCERLFLGSHKELDWNLMKKRADLKEILPIWHMASQKVASQIEEIPNEGSGRLFHACMKKIEENARTELYNSFLHLFHIGIEDLFIPKWKDEQFLGIIREEEVKSSPLPLLKGAFHLIRSLFFLEEKQEVALLPNLPPEFHSGRYVDILSKQGDLISIEWSKKLLKKVIWKVEEPREVSLKLQKKIDSFRVRMTPKGKGEVYSSKEPLLFLKKGTYYLDHFQK